MNLSAKKRKNYVKLVPIEEDRTKTRFFPSKQRFTKELI